MRRRVPRDCISVILKGAYATTTNPCSVLQSYEGHIKRGSTLQFQFPIYRPFKVIYCNSGNGLVPFATQQNIAVPSRKPRMKSAKMKRPDSMIGDPITQCLSCYSRVK
jgi:hypothetical protein